jgi:peptidyl-prolyl cis-trans isomerase NIMA-interacting 1
VQKPSHTQTANGASEREAAEKGISMSAAAGGEGETVRASHILIKHEGSRRKASWKDPDGRVISATTRADAAARLLDLRNQIIAGQANFADLAARHSDCSSARRGGDLGTVHIPVPALSVPSLRRAEIDLVVTRIDPSVYQVVGARLIIIVGLRR